MTVTRCKSGCNNLCRTGNCGDGVVADNEACDDGNTVDTDACHVHGSTLW